VKTNDAPVAQHMAVSLGLTGSMVSFFGRLSLKGGEAAKIKSTSSR